MLATGDLGFFEGETITVRGQDWVLDTYLSGWSFQMRKEEASQPGAVPCFAVAKFASHIKVEDSKQGFFFGCTAKCLLVAPKDDVQPREENRLLRQRRKRIRS
jgi:hypothetical protein